VRLGGGGGPRLVEVGQGSNGAANGTAAPPTGRIKMSRSFGLSQGVWAPLGVPEGGSVFFRRGEGGQGLSSPALRRGNPRLHSSTVRLPGGSAGRGKGRPSKLHRRAPGTRAQSRLVDLLVGGRSTVDGSAGVPGSSESPVPEHGPAELAIGPHTKGQAAPPCPRRSQRARCGGGPATARDRQRHGGGTGLKLLFPFRAEVYSLLRLGSREFGSSGWIRNMTPRTVNE